MPDARRDSGFSMIELTVAMALASVLAVAVAAVFAGVIRAVGSTRNTVDATADARVGIDAMVRLLAVAVVPTTGVSALVAGTATSLSFYASLETTVGGSATTPIPTLVSYAWTDQANRPDIGAQFCLTERRTPGVAVSPVPATGLPYTYATGERARCVMRTRIAPDFSYFTSASSTTPLALPVAAPASVQSVRVVLAGSSTTGTAPTSRVEDRLNLDNVIGAP